MDIIKLEHLTYRYVTDFMGKATDFANGYCTDTGRITIVKRILENNDFFLFIEYCNTKPLGEVGDASFELKFDNIIDIIQFEELYKKPPYDKRYGENKVSGLYGYIDLEAGSAVVSKLYNYREKIQKYDDGGASTVYELISESEPFEICHPDTVRITFDNEAKRDVKQQFFILSSKDKLFRNKENLDKYMRYYYDAVYNNNVWCSFFTTFAGTYTKLPYSIEPFTKDGYGYSLHHSSRKDMISFYRDTKERFFEDFIANAILQAYLYQQQDEGMFLTPYTSIWLKKDTGITAPYVDSRLNETFAQMIRDFQEINGWFAFLEPLKANTDFYHFKLGGGNMSNRKGMFTLFPEGTVMAYFFLTISKMGSLC